MYDEYISGNSTLSKVESYELRKDPVGRIIIDVHEILSSADPELQDLPLFIAIPNLVVKQARSEFRKRSSTKEGALKDCLSALDSVEDFRDIMEYTPKKL